MNKVRKQFVLFAVIAILVLLTALLAVINGINFTMASEDADRITERLARDDGQFGEETLPFAPRGDRPGQSSPDSPDLRASVRYFTFRFDKQGGADCVAWHINAFTREEAQTLAEELRGGTTGWTNLTYRYRVYRKNGATFVTVIDQARELTPCLRILVISAIGEVLSLAASVAFLLWIGKRLFRPLEEADRKQKEFMAQAENEFKVPLTVISAQNELIEKTTGPSEQTGSIRRQVGNMTDLIRRIALYETGEARPCDLSAILSVALEKTEPAFAEKGLTLTRKIEDGLMVEGSSSAFERAIDELIANSLTFAKGEAVFTLCREGAHVLLSAENAADLPDGDADAVFDRFTRLSNAQGVPGSGLGLSFVKETVRAHNGRLRASVQDGVFKLSVTF